MSKRIWFLSVGALLLLIAAGTIWDLPISQALNNPESLFARGLGFAGQVPTYALALIAVFMLRSKHARYAPIARVIMLTVIIQLLSIQMLKVIWGRPRFFMVADGFQDFRAWYVIGARATSDAFKSFPSGHAADSSVIACCLPLFAPSTKLRRIALNAAAIAWPLCVMLSRIILGMHYVSDVAFGALVTLISYQAAKWIASKVEVYEKDD